MTAPFLKRIEEKSSDTVLLWVQTSYHIFENQRAEKYTFTTPIQISYLRETRSKPTELESCP